MSIDFAIQRVDLASGCESRYPVPQEWEVFIGGSGLAARILYEETDGATDPLGAENVLIFMTGPFSATRVPTSGRHHITAKSPLTGIFGECDVGGHWGAALRRTGLNGLVLCGKSDSLVYIVVGEDKIEIHSAEDLAGWDTFATSRILKERHGSGAEIACIGPAGERLDPIACISHDGPSARMAGRCGLGAVMGSKGLKAVVVCGARSVPLADQTRFTALQKRVTPRMVEMTMSLKMHGTAGGVVGAMKMGDMPIKNWQRGDWPEAEEIGGLRMTDTILTKNFFCNACPIGCGREVEIKEGAYAMNEAAGPEYETLGLLGGSCMVSDLEAVSYAADLCNRAGIDTIETGNAVAMTMELYERGLLTADDLDGVKAEFGSAEALVALVRAACEGRGYGKLLAQGVAEMGRTLGPKAARYAMHVKGLALPAHDPRCFYSLAVGYATSNRGACHLQGATYFFEKTATLPDLGYHDAQEKRESETKARLNFDMQNVMCIMDSVKMCKFAFYGGLTLADIAEYYAAVTGQEISAAELVLRGERIFNLKRLYNCRCGVTAKDDRLPERILNEPRNDAGTGDALPPLDQMLEEYYRLRGWNENGIPDAERLRQLDLLQIFGEEQAVGASDNAFTDHRGR